MAVLNNQLRIPKRKGSQRKSTHVILEVCNDYTLEKSTLPDLKFLHLSEAKQFRNRIERRITALNCRSIFLESHFQTLKYELEVLCRDYQIL